MPQSSPNVKLISHTPEPLGVIYTSFRQCYSGTDAATIWDSLCLFGEPYERMGEFVKSIMVSGHTSPLEHVTFTFSLSGVSRSLTHQLVRHRIASYSQQSQRYVDSSEFGYVVPPAVMANPAALARFSSLMDEIGSAYSDIRTLLENDGHKTAREDARFVLPQAVASCIVVTMNCRALLNFFEHRCCTRAQWEIRGVAESMLGICRDVLPEVFSCAGARCERLGYCPEGPKFTCGRAPLTPKS